MNKILKSLVFPVIAIFIITTIYFGLSIRDLNKKIGLTQNQNRELKTEVSDFRSELIQNKNNLNQVLSLNNSLNQDLLSAKTQIASLQKNSGIKTVYTSPETQIITKTISQTVNQAIEKDEATVTIQNVGAFKVQLQSSDTAFSVLKRAAAENGFPLKYDTYSFGIFVTEIGPVKPAPNQYWAFYYNGAFSNVGASDQSVKKGDNIFWQLTSF